MEIKSKIEENIPIQGNNISISENKRLNSTNSFSFNTDLPDFEAYLQELDENKKTIAEEQQNVQAIIPQEKNTEALKTLKKLTEKENIPVKIDKIDDIKLFMRKKEGLRSLDNDININLDYFKKEDINFLRACLENPSMTLNNLNNQNFQAVFAVQNQNNQVSYKSFDVSKGLFNLIEYSFKAQKPVRLDFNGNSSVILKMHNDGKLIAEFISNDKAMEYILKSSIPGLKDKLDSEGIPYEEISYKDNSKNNNKRQNKGGNQ
ncbi:MAG: hypothetical protein A2039_06695 [Candidatus Melainabacteria bacterium GWA2_34_9]|nr:MAG: hypothetical protein A2039_06695 [Candidatus Melainabacteria bacterium GWA2_34_9]